MHPSPFSQQEPRRGLHSPPHRWFSKEGPEQQQGRGGCRRAAGPAAGQEVGCVATAVRQGRGSDATAAGEHGLRCPEGSHGGTGAAAARAAPGPSAHLAAEPALRRAEPAAGLGASVEVGAVVLRRPELPAHDRHDAGVLLLGLHADHGGVRAHLSQVAPDPALTAVSQVPRLSPESRLQTCQGREEIKPLWDPPPCPPGGARAQRQPRLRNVQCPAFRLRFSLPGEGDARPPARASGRHCGLLLLPRSPSCTGLEIPGAAPTRSQAGDRPANGVQARSRM